MEFYYKGKNWDTNKPVYVAFTAPSKMRFGTPIPQKDAKGEIEKCRQGHIIEIHIDPNSGQSFVTDFGIKVKNYSNDKIMASRYLVAESPKQVRVMAKEHYING